MSRRRAPALAVTTAPAPALPRWIRPPDGPADGSAAFRAGAALAALDPLIRATDPVGALWRRRLALGAATAIARLEGRREGEAELRDAYSLRRPGEVDGPAGRLLAGWRLLAEAQGPRAADWPARLPILFDLPPERIAAPLAAVAGRLPGRHPPLDWAAAGAAEILALGPAYRGLALWLADALLARALGWDRPAPLLAAHLPRSALGLRGPDWSAACAAGWTRAAVAAHGLYLDLDRRALALRAAAPRLRGRDAAETVGLLLTEDALAAQAGARASDRAARRLFERLTALGLVRELSGRATFRLYGL